MNVPQTADLLSFGDDLARRLDEAVSELSPEVLSVLLDPTMRQLMREAYFNAGADEGTLWVVDQAAEYLVPVFNSGPDAEKFIGKFRQPTGSGLICMVFAHETPFVENEIQDNPRQSKMLDDLLGKKTLGMIVVPFRLRGECRGVISCVRLDDGKTAEHSPREFNPGHLKTMEGCAAALSQLIEFRLLGRILGWNQGQ